MTWDSNPLNCFTHSLPFLGDPYFVAGACLPDWMSVVDRKVRFRTPRLEKWLEHEDARMRSLAKGIQQHLFDDRWFHATESFTRLNLDFSASIKRTCPTLPGFQTHFVGHILIEMLLDNELHQMFPDQLERYYRELDEIDSELLQQAVADYSQNPEIRVIWFFDRFRQQRFLFDYADDERLLFRVNQVMKRAGLESLGDTIGPWFRDARQAIRQSAPQLLIQYTTPLVE